MNGIQAVIAVSEGKSVQYFDHEDDTWLSFDKKTNFKLGCLLGEPNQHGRIAKFRMKPSFILINGIKVPAPLQDKPTDPISYWWFNPKKSNGIATGNGLMTMKIMQFLITSESIWKKMMLFRFGMLIEIS